MGNLNKTWQTRFGKLMNWLIQTMTQKPEDLLSKFCESLTDHGQRQAVEHTKEPNSINEAVRHAVLFKQTWKWHWNEYSQAQMAQEEDAMAQGSHHYEELTAWIGRCSRDKLPFPAKRKGKSQKRKCQDGEGRRPQELESIGGGQHAQQACGPCFRCNKMGHFAWECHTHDTFTCYNCQEKGQIAHNCPHN